MGIKITELRDLGFIRSEYSLGESILYTSSDKTVVESIIISGAVAFIYNKSKIAGMKLLNNYESILLALLNMKHPPAVAYSRSSKINSIFADEEESKHGDSKGT